MKTGSAVLLATALVACCVDTPDPTEITVSAMTETFVRMDIYARQHNTVPETLEILPQRSGYANRTTDGWDCALIYKIEDDGVLTLSSLGRDGRPGGSGPDADVLRRYRSRREDGSLWIGSDMWIVEAEIR